MTLATDGLFNAKAYRYTYADATARAAASGFVPADVGVFALQLDNASVWVLSDDSPVTWVAVGGGFANPMTTAGDLILGGSSGAPGRLAKGSDGDVLTISASTHLPVWSAPSGGSASFVGASAYRNSNQSINNATWTSVGLNQETKDTHAFHDNSTNNSRMTIPSGQDGRYRITGSALYANNGTGARYGRLWLNGTTAIDQDDAPGNGTYETQLRVMAEVDLVATDYVEMQVWQDSGGALNVITGGAFTPRLDIHMIG